jgi:hypothetical protein
MQLQHASFNYLMQYMACTATCPAHNKSLC